jgi:ribonuclease R
MTCAISSTCSGAPGDKPTQSRCAVCASPTRRTRGKRFGVSAEMNLAPGRLQMHPDGYGFVVLDDKATGDVFVKARELAGAMHADRVLVRIEQEIPGGRGPEGSIVRVLLRARASVVGRIERTGSTPT